MSVALVLFATAWMPQAAADRPCPKAPVLASAQRAPGVRPLDQEPPPRHIAAVDARRDGCPVLVALDRRDDKGRPAIEPVPETRQQHVLRR